MTTLREIVEKESVVRCIERKLLFEALPARVMKLIGGDKRNWMRVVIKYSLVHQLRWKTGLVRKVVSDERSYYVSLVKYSRDAMMVYPYHLSDVLTRGLKLSPFLYYRSLIAQMMASDKSYDELPNFTAVDAHRLLGVGRNEYINLLNICRAKTFGIFVPLEFNVDKLLPREPVACNPRPWWQVHISYVSEEDVKKCSELEHATIDTLIDTGAVSAGRIDRNVVVSLHRRGLIHFSVPIADDDMIKLNSLEKFVLNRVKGDYLEKLLYKIFITIDERTTVAQLAHVLQVYIELVKRALSLCIFLGFASKKHPAKLPVTHHSWREWAEQHSEDLSVSQTRNLLGGMDNSEGEEQQEGDSEGASKERIGFFFDSTLIAFLMMGNLAEGLKQHAVTLYEVGKLADEDMDEFVAHLDEVHEGDARDAEVRRYFEHAITLRNMLKTLRHHYKVDLVRCESLLTLDAGTRSRLIDKNYRVIVSMANMKRSEAVLTGHEEVAHFGPSLEMNSPWLTLYVRHLVGKSSPSAVLFPRDYRISPASLALSESDHVRVVSWANVASVVGASKAISFMNEKLRSAPVMMQRHPGPQAEVQRVAFPLRFEDVPEELIDAVQPLYAELALNVNVGYIEFVRSGAFWLLYDVVYGLPLLDNALCQRVLEAVLRYDTFSADNVEVHQRWAQAFSEKLRLFAMDHGASPIATDIPLPLREVVMQGE